MHARDELTAERPVAEPRGEPRDLRLHPVDEPGPAAPTARAEQGARRVETRHDERPRVLDGPATLQCGEGGRPPDRRRTVEDQDEAGAHRRPSPGSPHRSERGGRASSASPSSRTSPPSRVTATTARTIGMSTS